MKRNVQAQQRLRNRFLSDKCFPIFSLYLLFSVFLLWNASDAIGQTVTSQNSSEKIVINDRSLNTINLCQGDYYNNVQYNNVDTTITVSGSDTIIIYVHPTYNITVYESICEGETFIFGGMQLQQAGFYSDTLQTIHLCDSIINLHLSINENPIPQIFEMPNDFEVCGGDLTWCHTQWNQFNYQWDVFGGNVVAPWDYVNDTPIFDSAWIAIRWDSVNVIPNAFISINFTDAYGCRAPEPRTYDGTVNQSEEIVLNLPEDSICEGESYVLNGFYLFNLPAGVYDTSYTKEGDAELCQNDTIVRLRLTVLPNPDISITPYESTIYAGQSVTLEVNDAEPSISTEYFWHWVNGSDIGESIIVSPLTNTSYNVMARNLIGCTDMAYAFVYILTLFDKPDSLEFTTEDCLPVLTWQAPDTIYYMKGFVGYNIYRDGIFIARVGKDVLTFTDERLEGKTYEYCITAVYTLPYDPSRSQESEPECQIYTNPIPEYFEPPQDVYAYPSYDCSIVVIWEAPKETCWGEVVAYNVYRNLHGSFEKYWINLPSSQLYFEDTDVHVKGANYTYCVQAVYDNFSGVSDSSVACSSTKIDCGLAINIYPNPGDQQVTIVANDMDYIKIYDVLGKFYTQIQVPIEAEHCNIITIPTAMYESGTYVFKIYFKENENDDSSPSVAVRRVVIVHK